MFPKQLIVFKHAWWIASINICHICPFDTNDVIKDLAAGLQELKKYQLTVADTNFFQRQLYIMLWTSIKCDACIGSPTQPALEFI